MFGKVYAPMVDWHHLTFASLLTQTQDAGGRLCTADELEDAVGKGTGCGYNGKKMWSSTPCATNGGVTKYYVVQGKGEASNCAWPNANNKYASCCADETGCTGGSRLLLQDTRRSLLRGGQSSNSSVFS